MKVYLIRHGQTNYNVLNIHNSDPTVDVHLTKLGVEQAEKLADALKSKSIERIFASELKRTQQTANIVNEYHKVEIVVDKRLNDNKSGYEDQSDDEFYEQLKKSEDKWNARFNGGESLNDVWNRVDDFIRDLSGQQIECCAVVSSKVIIQYFCAIIKGIPKEKAADYYVDKGSCTELVLSKEFHIRIATARQYFDNSSSLC